MQMSCASSDLSCPVNVGLALDPAKTVHPLARDILLYERLILMTRFGTVNGNIVSGSRPPTLAHLE